MPLNRRKDRLTAEVSILIVTPLDCFGLVREFRVLDEFAKPMRIVAFAKVEEPRFVVNSFHHAIEDLQIVSS